MRLIHPFRRGLSARLSLGAALLLGGLAAPSAALATGTISGHVQDVSQGALGSICVNAYLAPNQPPVSGTATDSSGNYSLEVPAGTYRVQFHDDCGGSGNYVQQWYSGTSDFSSATAVNVTDGATTPGIGATMVLGGHISGHVADAGTAAAVPNICVNANAAQNQPPAGGTSTDAQGNYTIHGLPAGTYRVQFHDDCGGSGNYVQQWYNGKSDFSSANPVAVTAGQGTLGINASMQLGGRISGHVENAVSHANLQNICVGVLAPSSQGQFLGGTMTDSGGNYTVRGVPAGNVKVMFNDTCTGAGGNYVQQFYNNRTDFASADLVIVTAEATTTGINAAMQPAAHITGHVQAAGTAESLQNICVAVMNANTQGMPAGFTTTNASGNYNVGGLPAGTYKVQFNDNCGGGGSYIEQWYNGKPDWNSAEAVSLTAGQTRSEINATMQRGGQISGHVEDAVSHAGLSKICVGVFSASSFGQPVAGISTDESGNYTIHGLPAGSYKVMFNDNPGCGGSGNYVQQFYNGKSDFQLADQVSVTAGKTTPGINAAMQRGGHITGHVEAAGSATGLANICVAVQDATAHEAPFGGFATTDSNGNYDVGELPEGTYKVQFNDNCGGSGDYVAQYYNNQPDWNSASIVSVKAGQTTSAINAVMQRGGQISGHVEDAASHADLQGICVSISEASSGEPTEQSFGFATTDSEGSYTIRGVPAGTYKVQFNDNCGGIGNYVEQWYNDKPDFSHANSVSVTVGKTTTGISAAMRLGGRITGHVQAEGTLANLQGICVSASDGNGNWVGGSSTDQNGDYAITGLPSGTYKVQFSDNFECGGGGEYIQQWYEGKGDFNLADGVSVTAGNATSDIDATMQLGGRISGHVQAAGSLTSLQGICVEAIDASLTDPYSQPSAGYASTDVNGNYTIGGLPTGSYKVQFHDDTWCDGSGNYIQQWYNNKADFSVANGVNVTAGQTSVGVNATMRLGGHIAGFVEDASTHASLQNICVDVTDATGNSVGWGQTDSSGHYDIGSLPSGAYRVQFHDDLWCGGGNNYVQQWYNNSSDFGSAEMVTVTAGQTTTDIDAAMQRGGHISGHVGAAGGPTNLANVCVDAVDANGNGVSGASTNENGEYDIGTLPAGSYKVSFHDDSWCGGSGNYIQQWYSGKPDFGSANTVNVTGGQTTSGIGATMQLGGHITGHVQLDALHPLANICVSAVGPGGQDLSGALTDSSGNYNIGTLPTGAYTVRFDDCNEATQYTTQYYNDKTWFQTPDAVSVTAPGTKSGINATMHPGGATLSGRVTDAATGQPVENTCVGLFLPSNISPTSAVRVVGTGPNGGYSIAGLPAGEYKVSFANCGGGGTRFARQWFSGEVDAAVADTITLTAGQSSTNIDAAMSGSSTAGNLDAGGSIATGPEASPSDPAIAEVRLPAGTQGYVEINSDGSITTSAPSGFSLFARQFVIYAPTTAAGTPLTLTFTLDATQLNGIDPAIVSVFHDGSPVPSCTGGSSASTANPDPCLKSKAVIAGGDLQLTVLTSHASIWNTGYAVVKPAATTAAASAITSAGATLSGTVNPHGLATTYHFEYGTSTGYGSSAPSPDASVGSDSSDHVLAQAISGLAPGTIYHFRIVASSTAGASYGNDQTFITASSSPPPPAPPTAPASTSPPLITGTATVGQPLSSSTGTWSGSAPLSYSYQWQSCVASCTNIAGATGGTYTLTPADTGATVRVLVTAANAGGSAQAASAQVGPVAPSAAQIRAQLLAQLAPAGKSAKIKALLKRGGYPLAFKALWQGRLSIDWYYLPRGAKLSKAKPVLVASGRASFTRAGTVNLTIKLTAKGKRMLRAARTLKLIAKGIHTPAGGAAVAASKSFTLRR